MLAELLHAPITVTACALFAACALLLLAFLIRVSGELWGRLRRHGYVPVGSERRDHHLYPAGQQWPPALRAGLNSAGASLSWVWTRALWLLRRTSTLAAAYSDTILSALYPSRPQLDFGQPVPADDTQAARGSWLNPRGWYSTISHW